MVKSVIFAAAALALALPVAAPVAASSTDDSGDKMICKYRMETGTRFKKKKCMTAAQWEEMSEQHRAGAKEMVDRPKILICGPQAGC
jgi:hypothetical protein